MVKKIGQDKKKAKRIACKHCGAKLEYYPKDVKSQSFVSMCEMEVVCWIVCPECKTHVLVK